MEIKIDFAWGTLAKMIGRLNALDASISGPITYEIVKAITDKVLDESVKRTPIDEGNLIASQHKTVVKEGLDWVGYVYIPANSPGSDYAMYIHEAHYKLGPTSAMKQAGQSEVVGRKYLERAMTENVGKYQNYVKVRLARFFKDGI